MRTELELKEMLNFIHSCDVSSNYEKDLLNQTSTAKNYLERLKVIDKNGYEKIIKDVENKLKLIISRNSENKAKNSKVPINLVTDSLTDYIINKVKAKRLTDPKLIARYVYIELARNLYYDISYTKVSDEQKQIIVNTPIDVKNAKLFSYVVCSQWSQLYSYILNYFGIENKIMQIPGQDHRWCEINLHNGEIIIADATDYIRNSIDFSNAKAISETTGFYILPQEYSGLKLGNVFSYYQKDDTAKKIIERKRDNEDLDISLGYIDAVEGYLVNRLLNSSELFNQKKRRFDDSKELFKFLESARRYLHKLDVPNNMDGYEIFAYYHKFIDQLPPQVSGNISIKTIYADLFSYKQNILKRKYFKAPSDYIKYLEELVYDRYYEYLNKNEKIAILEQIKKGLISSEKISSLVLAEEIKIAELNRRLNPYYAINEVAFYRGIIDDTKEDYYEYYEPNIGKQLIKSTTEAMVFRKNNRIL